MGSEGFSSEASPSTSSSADGWNFDLGAWSITICEGLTVKTSPGLSMMFGFRIYKVKDNI